MNKLLLAILASLLILPSSLKAQEQEDQAKETKKKPSITSQISKLKAELRDEVAELTKEYRKVDSPADRNKVVGKRRDFEKQIVDKLIELTNERSSSSRNIRDLCYFVGRTKGAARDLAITTLLKKYSDDGLLTSLNRELARSKPSQEVEDWIRKVLKECDNENVQADATLKLAQYLSELNEFREFAASDDEYMSARSSEEVMDEVESLLNECLEKYSDNRTVRNAAKGMLTRMKIRVGSIAPDIVGLDLDGKEFKLSDYRGKVVVLDFWGDW